MFGVIGNLMSWRLIGIEILRFIRANRPSVGFTNHPSSFCSASNRSAGVFTTCHNSAATSLKTTECEGLNQAYSSTGVSTDDWAIFGNLESGPTRKSSDTHELTIGRESHHFALTIPVADDLEKAGVVRRACRHKKGALRVCCNLANQLGQLPMLADFEPFHSLGQAPCSQ